MEGGKQMTGTPENARDGTAEMGGFPRVHVDELSAEEFDLNFIRRNRPAIVVGATCGWRAQQEWVVGAGRGDVSQGTNASTRKVPNLELMREQFGKRQVPVVNCRKLNQRREMTMDEYVAWWRSSVDDSYNETSGAPLGSGCKDECAREGLGCVRTAASGTSAPEPWWYLKDWHFACNHPDYRAYETPSYFRSDWLNAFWDDQGCPDHRFVYLGMSKYWRVPCRLWIEVCARRPRSTWHPHRVAL
eukprot:scaffold2357_cov399-Prasinococcus_capsulatus_cf.AAC.11